jgi:ERCC4-type nuclease
MAFDHRNMVAVIDSREQRPLVLKLSADGEELKTERGSLYTADYSLKGLEKHVAIERKSLPDLLMCVGRERERFEKEIDRLLGVPVRGIVVESSWEEIEAGRYRSRVKPTAAIGSMMGWIARGIPITMAGNAERAGIFVARMLYITARRRYQELKGLG